MSTMRYRLNLIAGLMVLNGAALATGQVTFDFQDVTLGSSYQVGQQFSTLDPSFVAQATITPVAFESGPPGYVWSTRGSVVVANGGYARRSGNELTLGNVNLALECDGVGGAWNCCNHDIGLTELSFFYGQSNGNLNMGVNGQFYNFDRFSQLGTPPYTFPGVTVSVTSYGANPPNFDEGFVKITGLISGSQFLIYDEPVVADLILGGVELYIDDVSISVRGDFDGDGKLTANDIDLLSAANPTDPLFDLDHDGIVTDNDRTVWVVDLRGSYFGDANFDCVFNSNDFVQVFVFGKYETGEAAGWAEGDWNGDGYFDSNDFVTAMTAGGYELGPRACPEPSGGLMLLLGFAGLMRRKLSKSTGRLSIFAGVSLR